MADLTKVDQSVEFRDDYEGELDTNAVDTQADIYNVEGATHDNAFERTDVTEELFEETDALLDNRSNSHNDVDSVVDACSDRNDATKGYEVHHTGVVLVEAIDDEESERNGENLEIVEEETKAPDGGWGWFIILGALVLRMIAGGLGRSHGLFYIKFVERYGGNATATALVTALTGLFRIGVGPFVSILCTRVPCRYLTFIGACLLSTGLILTGYSPSLQFLYFSYGVVSGIGRAFALTPVPILLGYYFDKRRSLAFGLASAGFSLGGFCITPVVEVFFQTVGFQGTYLLLGGIALNIAVCSALFRPIELHRQITQRSSKRRQQKHEPEAIIVRSIEDIQAGDDLSSSTISIERIRSRSNSSKDNRNVTRRHTDRRVNNTVSIKLDNVSDARNDVTDSANNESKQLYPEESALANRNSTTDTVSKNITPNYVNDNVACSKSGTNDMVSNGIKPPYSDDKTIGVLNDTDNTVGYGAKPMHSDDEEEGVEKAAEEKPKKKPLIAWSILKDVRFLCFCFANFLLTLPTNSLFLPSLAKARGATDMQAASLLSICAGSDTLFRVVAGFVLDMKLFRNIRPQIYSAVLLMSGLISLMFPLMGSYPALVLLVIVDGLATGLKAAQNSVVLMDILGVDKLASSQAIMMSVQSMAIVIGSVVAGRLKDASGVYDGAFYFGGCAILLAGLVMAGGNVRKYLMDRRKREEIRDREV